MSDSYNKYETKVAVVVSHPIQHFVHFYRGIAALGTVDLKVFFCSSIGIKSYFDKDMGEYIKWADDMTGGYNHEFLIESDAIKSVGFRKVDNPSVSSALDRFKPDAVIVYGYAQMTQLRALGWCIRSRTPALMITDTNAVTKRFAVKAFVRALLLRRLFARVSGFLTVGDQNERALEEMGVPTSKLHRTPFTIDERRYRQAQLERVARRSAIRVAHGIPEDAFVCLFVGKLIPRKRAMDAARVIRDMATENRQVHLLICGNGPGSEEIDQFVQESGAPITQAGFVNTDKLPDYFCASDILIHPAEHDPHPLICSEAAAIGLPMILSDKVGTIGESDISRPDKNTLVYPCGDLNALRVAIAELSDHPDRFQSMSTQSLRIFEENSLVTSIAGLCSALQSVAKRSDHV